MTINADFHFRQIDGVRFVALPDVVVAGKAGDLIAQMPGMVKQNWPLGIGKPTGLIGISMTGPA